MIPEGPLIGELKMVHEHSLGLRDLLDSLLSALGVFGDGSREHIDLRDAGFLVLASKATLIGGQHGGQQDQQNLSRHCGKDKGGLVVGSRNKLMGRVTVRTVRRAKLKITNK